MWFDWRKEGTLLAGGGYDQIVKIYDTRAGKIIKNIDGLHEGNSLVDDSEEKLLCEITAGPITCVRWNSAGKLIATASWDGTVKIIDFANPNQVLYSGETTELSK